MATFGQTVFHFLTTIAPSWRVSDDAWPLGNEYLVGIGVLRNYGGAALVIPWDQDSRRQLLALKESLNPLMQRIVVIVDDRGGENLQPIRELLAPIVVLPWSGRAELTSLVTKDAAD